MMYGIFQISPFTFVKNFSENRLRNLVKLVIIYHVKMI